MAKAETKHEILMIYQEFGGGDNPINLMSERVTVAAKDSIYEKVEAAYKKLQEKLPKR